MSYADVGQLPVIIGLVLIWLIFQAANSHFLSPVNLTNLILQSAAMGNPAPVGVTLCPAAREIDSR